MIDQKKREKMLTVAAHAVGLDVGFDWTNIGNGQFEVTGVRFYRSESDQTDESLVFKVDSLKEANIFLAGWVKGKVPF